MDGVITAKDISLPRMLLLEPIISCPIATVSLGEADAKATKPAEPEKDLEEAVLRKGMQDIGNTRIKRTMGTAGTTRAAGTTDTGTSETNGTIVITGTYRNYRNG